MKASNNKEEKPHFVKRDKFAITAEYKQWFADIKSRLRNSQIKQHQSKRYTAGILLELRS